MLTITWYNQHNQSWADDHIFTKMKDADEYLTEQGYQLKEGWYRRAPKGWEGHTRAVISGVKIYAKEKQEQQTWKEMLKFPKSEIFADSQIAQYLEKAGFKTGVMKCTEEGYLETPLEQEGAPCLVLTGQLSEKWQVVVRINDIEAMVEKISDSENFYSVSNEKHKKKLTIETIDDVLNKLLGTL